MSSGGRPLARATDRKLIGGVCAGLADYLGTAPWIVRTVFLASCLLPGPQFILYIILWIAVPARKI